jgi:site-specific DNA recombinase
VAYIASQKPQGWTCLAARYDDRGISGATTERPALQRLLADVAAGEVDAVVVQRVDRLSRSLLGFSRIVDALEKNDCSFVSVSQRFDTTDSMGRLTLNMLLSFAQFERELIAERTRDKSHAARRRGRFTGSTPVLGFDIAGGGGRLVVNEEEAEQVRLIFATYLKSGSLIPCVQRLNAMGATTKRHMSRKGGVTGGKPFVKTSLHAVLTNPVVIGKVRFNGELFEGEHPAIIDEEMWNRVQAKLRANGNGDGRSTRGSRRPALLRGLLHCARCGCPMTFTYTSSGSKRYAYYKCATALKQGAAACTTEALPAKEVEDYVVRELAAIGRDEGVIAETVAQARALADAEVHSLEAERDALKGALEGLEGQIREAATAAPSGANALRMADLQAEAAEMEARMGAVHKQLDEARAGHLDETDVRRALADFDGLWEEMTPSERARTLHALVERVAYDGQAETVAITFQPTGIKALAGETR